MNDAVAAVGEFSAGKAPANGRAATEPMRFISWP